jgi:HAD superfamily hydrolase (TIGR01509 family)
MAVSKTAGRGSIPWSPALTAGPIAAVIFDLDGLLLDSESAWDGARRALVAERGGRWKESATRDMLGMSSLEWSRYVRDELAVDMEPEQISAAVVEQLLEGYREELPWLPGAREAVERMAARWPLGLASSSNREVIELFMERSGLENCFRAWVSSEEVGRGKPAPDVFEEAARRVGVEPKSAAAIEDSHNGILAARAAGMTVLAVPNHEFPPDPAVLEQADAVLATLDELTPEAVVRAAAL